MKSAGFGLPEDVEIKWSLSEKHPTRLLLDKLGKSTKDLAEASISFIQKREDITCLAAVMTECRSVPIWRKVIWSGASVRDFYCEGLRYVLQRVAEEVELESISQTTIVLDTPSLGKAKFSRGTIERGTRGVFERYRDWYASGVGPGPSRAISQKPLQDLGFDPAVLVSAASYHDLLQVADVVVGCTTSWVKDIVRGARSSFATELTKQLSANFRNRYPSAGHFFGDGFVLWPMDLPLWTNLQHSLR